MSKLAWLTQRPIAHRGLHDMNKSVWENTLSAFRRAIDGGYAIECDVHITADGAPIIFHDNVLKRLTGADGYIWQRTLAEMQALRIGGTQDYPPTLVETLDLIGGRTPIIIELKGIPGEDDGLVEKVCSILKGYDGHAAIMSFDHWLIRQMPNYAGSIPCGLTALGEDRKDLEAHFSMLGYGIDFVSYCAAHMPNHFVTFVRKELKTPVITWTVRDEAALQHSYRHGDQITFEGFRPEDVTIA
jgi:glycerophosphoryl diester phosphodiesterase